MITMFPEHSHHKLDNLGTAAAGLDVVDHHPDVHLLLQLLLVHSLLHYSGTIVPGQLNYINTSITENSRQFLDVQTGSRHFTET